MSLVITAATRQGEPKVSGVGRRKGTEMWGVRS